MSVPAYTLLGMGLGLLLGRTLITATNRRLFAEFSATAAIPSLACARTMTSCYSLWRGI